jgi:ribosomal protein L37AE/L43A
MDKNIQASPARVQFQVCRICQTKTVENAGGGTQVCEACTAATAASEDTPLKSIVSSKQLVTEDLGPCHICLVCDQGNILNGKAKVWVCDECIELILTDDDPNALVTFVEVVFIHVIGRARKRSQEDLHFPTPLATAERRDVRRHRCVPVHNYTDILPN